MKSMPGAKKRLVVDSNGGCYSAKTKRGRREGDGNKMSRQIVRARQKGDSKREKSDPECTFSQIFADFR